MEEKNIIYFAYGSNLNLRQMKLRCPNSKVIGKGIIENYRLAFKGSKRNFSFLTIEQCEGSVVPIGIFQISSEDERRLDIYEGYPRLYSKETINAIMIQNDEEKIKIDGIIYIMNPYYNYNKPSPSYYFTCEEGYKDFDFDNKYLESAYSQCEIQILKKYLPKKDSTT